ncbi:hypothetical protein PR048_018548 [Dryococelus australis]|uniref:PiggyBac transposable element-derived protein domain-containing protein n=1 Tax=Dryococelus australis TaxID=614101 RepID=A0ABQ9HCI8_9NEOP|nr:hypothetical protein PR048_018548 [Dryococelus australis]
MERIRKINRDIVIVPPKCSDDSVADDTDQDPDYSPNQNRHRCSSTSGTETSEDEVNPTPPKEKKISERHQYARRYLYDDEATQSNLYCVQKCANKSANTVTQEIEQFIDTCAYMRIYSLPQRRHLWGRSTRVEKVADVVSRDSKSNLHFNDNSQYPSVTDPDRDRLFKIRPVIHSLQVRFKQLPDKEEMLCIDEQIVPFE